MYNFGGTGRADSFELASEVLHVPPIVPLFSNAVRAGQSKSECHFCVWCAQILTFCSCAILTLQGRTIITVGVGGDSPPHAS